MRNAALAAGACISGTGLGYSIQGDGVSVVFFGGILAFIFGVLSALATHEETGR